MVPAAYLANSVVAAVSTSVREATTTRTPWAARPRHMARPIPLLPPVTIATLPCNVIAVPSASAACTHADASCIAPAYGTLHEHCCARGLVYEYTQLIEFIMFTDFTRKNVTC